MKKTVDSISAQIGPDRTIGLLVSLSQGGSSEKRKLNRIMDNSLSGVSIDHKKHHGNGTLRSAYLGM